MIKPAEAKNKNTYFLCENSHSSQKDGMTDSYPGAPVVCLPYPVNSDFHIHTDHQSEKIFSDDMPDPVSMFSFNSLTNLAIGAPSITSWSIRTDTFNISLMVILSSTTTGFLMTEPIPKHIGCTDIGMNQPLIFPIIPIEVNATLPIVLKANLGCFSRYFQKSNLRRREGHNISVPFALSVFEVQCHGL